MGFNAVTTFAVFSNGLFQMSATDDDHLMVEGWRTFGYLVFTAMWTMLAFRPRQVPASSTPRKGASRGGSSGVDSLRPLRSDAAFPPGLIPSSIPRLAHGDPAAISA